MPIEVGAADKKICHGLSASCYESGKRNFINLVNLVPFKFDFVLV